MRFHTLRGPFLLVLWQAAPIGVQEDESGRYRLTLGFGGGQFEDRSLNCAGEVVDARPVPFRAAGASFEAWPTGNLHVTFHGTGLWLDESNRSTLLGGALIGYEGGKAGVGLGYARALVEGTPTHAPSMYLNLGSREGLHFRTDFYHPSATFATAGQWRMGLGHNRSYSRKWSGYLGLSLGPYADESHVVGFFGQGRIPVVGRFDLQLGARYTPSYEFTDWGLGAGASVALGKKP